MGSNPCLKFGLKTWGLSQNLTDTFLLSPLPFPLSPVTFYLSPFWDVAIQIGFFEVYDLKLKHREEYLG
jgi:hypothetical protein